MSQRWSRGLLPILWLPVSSPASGLLDEQQASLLPAILIGLLLASGGLWWLQSWRRRSRDSTYRALLEQTRGQLLDSVMEQRPLLQLMERLAMSWSALQPGSNGSVLLVDEHARINTIAAPGLPASYSAQLDGLHAAEGVGSCGTAIARCAPVFVADVQTDPLWMPYQALAETGGFRSCWSMPFFDESGRVLGTFAVYGQQPGLPDTRARNWMLEFTRLAALAVQKTRLAEQHELSRQRFTAVFHQAALPMLLVSAEGVLLEANPRFAELFGYQPEANACFDLRSWLHPDDLRTFAPQLRELLDQHTHVLDGELRIRLPDGRFDWFKLNISLVSGAHGAHQSYLLVAEDISQRKATELAMQEAAAVFEHSREGMLVTDAGYRISTVNPAFTRITGLTPGQVQGRTVMQFNLDTGSGKTTEQELAILQQDGYWQGEVRIQGAGGQPLPLWVTATLIHSADGQLERCLIMFNDLSRLRRSQEQLYRLTNFDSLTGLPNRVMASFHLQQLLSQAGIRDCRLAVLYIDLDKFKSINDNLGHECGDQVLREAASRLQSECGPADMLARLAADEFMLIVDGCEADQARELAGRLCQSMREPFLLDDGRQLYLSASVGFAMYPDDAASAAELIRKADTAMDSVKLAGRDGVRQWAEEMDAQVSQRFELERDMRIGLEHSPEQFVLYYQPLIDLQTRQVRGVEALLRWQHPQRGLIGPDLFIPVAELTGLIVPLGRRALDGACRQLQQWQSEGLALEFVSVNLSPLQFSGEDLQCSVAETLANSGLAPEALVLEITESALMTDVQKSLDTLHVLKRMRVRLALDDFGTGYSSLSHLRSFPLDKLKIDRSFMQGVPESRGDSLLLASILELAAGLQLEVVAEGVETEAQLQFLYRHDCAMAQGFLLSRPLPVGQLQAWLAQDGDQ